MPLPPSCTARTAPAALPAGGRSCAVVGSSDVLRLVPRGAEIDGHDVVWRLNNAPTRGFEAEVGRRTTIRMVNHVPIEKWLLRSRNRTALSRTADGAEYSALLCSPSAVEQGCIVSRLLGGKGFAANVEAYRRLHATHQLSLVSDELIRAGSRCAKELGGTNPSGGLLAVMLALSSCERPVSLYGFWPFCCKPHRGFPAMNYKYSQGNRTRWVCCSRGREKMELEHGLYEHLAKKGLVRIFNGRDGGGRAPAAAPDRPRAGLHAHVSNIVS